MARPNLVIELGPGGAGALIFSGAGDAGPRYAYAPAEEAGGLDGALSSVLDDVAAGCGASEFSPALVDDVYLSIHPGDVSQRPVTLPLESAARAREVLGFELDGKLPVEVDEAVIDAVPLAGGSAGANRFMAVATEKRRLKELLDKLSAFGLDPVRACPAYIEISVLLASFGDAGRVRACVGRGFIAVSEGDKPLFFAPYDDIEGLTLALACLGTEGAAIDELYTAGVEGSGLAVLFPGAELKGELPLPDGLPTEAGPLWAVATSARAGRSLVDFRQGELRYTRGRELMKKRLRVSAALVAVIILILAGDVFMRFRHHAEELGAYSEAVRSSYLELFPGEGAASVDELYALEAKLRTLEKEAGLLIGLDALGLLKTITRAGSETGAGIRLIEVSAGEGRLNARGQGASFEGASRFRDILSRSGAFTDVKLSDVASRSEGGVTFSVTMALIAQK